MHKELNLVVGGYAACAKFWEDSGFDLPVLLANKDNNATIKLVALSGLTSEAADRAVKALERGAVKLMQLAGSLFHHKNDKKGYQDQHHDYFQDIITENSQFPDVSNTCYHSTCPAACHLTLYLSHYRIFMEVMHDQKTKPGFNHMEANVYKGLHDILTLTELAVLCLYYLTITGPYSIAVCGPGTENVNMLELGPLHERLKTHLKKLIEHLELVLGSDEAMLYAKNAMLDGQEWLDIRVVDALMALKLHFPHLTACFVTFLKGAQETWERFTSEFVPDGMIAQATAEEKQLAFMLSTNNANEGALGMWQKWAREKGTTIARFIDHAMFHRNKMQRFIDAKFTTPDQKWLMKIACEINHSGWEKLQRKKLTQYIQQKAQERQEKLSAHLEKAAKRAVELAIVDLVFDLDQMNGMTWDQLDDQLDLQWKIDKDMETVKCRVKNKPQKIAEIKAALEQCEIESWNITEEDSEDPETVEDDE